MKLQQIHEAKYHVSKTLDQVLKRYFVLLDTVYDPESTPINIYVVQKPYVVKYRDGNAFRSLEVYHTEPKEIYIVDDRGERFGVELDDLLHGIQIYKLERIA